MMSSTQVTYTQRSYEQQYPGRPDSSSDVSADFSFTLSLSYLVITAVHYADL